jgi:hypothetical protein
MRSHLYKSHVLQYLKEQRLPPQTFIPLQSVRVKPIIERLRTLGGSAQLIFDVIQYPFFPLYLADVCCLLPFVSFIYILLSDQIKCYLLPPYRITGQLHILRKTLTINFGQENMRYMT